MLIYVTMIFDAKFVLKWLLLFYLGVVVVIFRHSIAIVAVVVA